MSYKINEIKKVDSWENRHGFNNYTYLSGFEFKGECYYFGWVTLNENGMKKFHTNNPRAEIVNHFIYPSGAHAYCIYKFSSYDKYKKWKSVTYYLDSLDDYLENADNLDYKNMTIEDLYKLPQDQFMHHVTMKNIADGKSDPLAPETTAKPLFKDWEVPELVVGWIGFIVFFIGVFVFKDWLFQLVLRIIGGCIFGWWRQMKVMGFK